MHKSSRRDGAPQGHPHRRRPIAVKFSIGRIAVKDDEPAAAPIAC